MINSFKDEITDEIYNGLQTPAARKVPLGIIIGAQRKMDLLNSVSRIETLDTVPSLQLEGGIVRDAYGKYSISVSGSWRIAFCWNHDKADEVELYTS
jgi:plasmid maintenance system killer protein